MSNVLNYKGYSAAVNFSNEDEVFYGKIFGINDLVSFEGKSVNELKKAFRESVDDYLETCKQLKKSPDKPFKGSFNIRVSEKLHREAAHLATQKHITLNELVSTAIHNLLLHKNDAEWSIKDKAAKSLPSNKKPAKPTIKRKQTKSSRKIILSNLQ